MKTFVKKFTSRKFILAIVGIVVGLCGMFGIKGGSIETIASAVMSVMSALIYIVTEGRIDAENIKKTAEDVNKAIDTVKEAK